MSCLLQNLMYVFSVNVFFRFPLRSDNISVVKLKANIYIQVTRTTTNRNSLKFYWTGIKWLQMLVGKTGSLNRLHAPLVSSSSLWNGNTMNPPLRKWRAAEDRWQEFEVPQNLLQLSLNVSGSLLAAISTAAEYRGHFVTKVKTRQRKEHFLSLKN